MIPKIVRFDSLSKLSDSLSMLLLSVRYLNHGQLITIHGKERKTFRKYSLFWIFFWKNFPTLRKFSQSRKVFSKKESRRQKRSSRRKHPAKIWFPQWGSHFIFWSDVMHEIFVLFILTKHCFWIIYKDSSFRAWILSPAFCPSCETAVAIERFPVGPMKKLYLSNFSMLLLFPGLEKWPRYMDSKHGK